MGHIVCRRNDARLPAMLISLASIYKVNVARDEPSAAPSNSSIRFLTRKPLSSAGK
jgi:hypothetical protein